MKTENELLELISNQLTGIHILLVFIMLGIFYIVLNKMNK